MAASVRRTHLAARFDAASTATLDELVPLLYERTSAAARDGLTHVRAASALRRFANRLVIVQDDVNAFAVRNVGGGGVVVVRSVLLPPHPSGQRVFDDTLGNKHEKLDLEACVTLPDGRLVAFGSGSLPAREQLIVWREGEAPITVPAASFFASVRSAVTDDSWRLNLEGAIVSGERLLLLHRGNDAPRAGRAAANAVVELDAGDFARWLDGAGVIPRVMGVTSVDLGVAQGVAFGFTDAVALDDKRVVLLACAEDSANAIADGAVLGCRVGLLDEDGLRTVDVCAATGERTLLKLEGIERRVGTLTEFDVVVDVDRPSAPAQLGRLVWDWR